MHINFKRRINQIIGFLGYRVSKAEHSNYFNFQALLNHYLNHYETLSFVQIGGCDGESFDPLYPKILSNPTRFEGIIVEPVHAYFNELSARYSTFERIKTLNLAVHNEKEKATIYRPQVESLPHLPVYAKGTASFNKSHLQKFNIPSDMIVEEEVPCISLNDLLRKYNLKPDLMITDTEGYDSEIICNYDFDYHKPPLIYFEHGLPDEIMKKHEIDQVEEVLHRAGYNIIFEYYDALAYRKESLMDSFPTR
ncbi:MAG: FkbM family methyltransferase [Balneolaceae bacterium]|nr:FkbM family methyltransferase [Balneolaceae bacterium]